MLTETYKGLRVLVTGHTGFKGSWLCLWLAEMGAEVTGYALPPPTAPNHFDLLDLPMTSVIGDIRDAGTLAAAVETHRPEIVFHMAAQPLVRLSYHQPQETIDTNVMGTVNLFEACRRTPTVRAIVNITSDKCYENREWVWGYREIDPMGGFDPYSASKGCAELITAAYRNSFFPPDRYGDTHQTLAASVRAGNVIGGGDWAEDRLIPDIMRAASNGETTVIRNPDATRPWQHVLEPLSGYLHLGARLLGGDRDAASAWNFGPADEYTLTVRQVADRIARFWPAARYTLAPLTDRRPHEANLLKLDSSKANVRLGWRCVWDAETTFRRTVEWYRGYYETGTAASAADLAIYLKTARDDTMPWTAAKEE